MKKYFCVFLTIAFILTGIGITLSERGFDNGRWNNRDEQDENYRQTYLNEDYTERIARDSDGDAANNDDDYDYSPLTTSAYGKARQTLAYHNWSASSSVSNSDPDFYGSWSAFADVPNTDPDEDSNPGYTGTVGRSFSRSDTDWFAYLDTNDSINDCRAWAYIDGKDLFNAKLSHYSYANISF